MSGTELEVSVENGCEDSSKKAGSPKKAGSQKKAGSPKNVFYVLQNYPNQDSDDFSQTQKELVALIKKQFPNWLEIRKSPNVIAASCRWLRDTEDFEALLTVISKFADTHDKVCPKSHAPANAEIPEPSEDPEK